jgi:acyl-CoA dehydrogenase
VGRGVLRGVGAHIGIATPPIARFGTPEQCRRWLEPALGGERIAALAITEPHAGSDVASLRTRGVRVDGGWLVNGSKTFITNGVRADFLVTAVRTLDDPGHGGVSLLVIDRQEGVHASKLEKLGWRASDTAEIAFDDVFVPDDALLGEEGRGFYLIMANFQGERLGMALFALGEMRQAFSETLAWLHTRPRVTQYARHTMAELATRIETSAAMTYGTLRRYVAGEDMVREVTATKLLTQRACLEVVDACMSLRGIEGGLRDTGLERALRDARLGPIGGGTDEIMREILGRSLGL